MEAIKFRQKVTCALLDSRSAEEQLTVALKLLWEAVDIIHPQVNAQQPCGTCRGSKQIDNPECVNCSYYPLGEACLNCNQVAKVPCPDCQPSGELAKMKSKWGPLEPHQDSTLDYAICDIYKQAARLDALEKACRYAITALRRQEVGSINHEAIELLQAALGEKKGGEV